MDNDLNVQTKKRQKKLKKNLKKKTLFLHSTEIEPEKNAKKPQKNANKCNLPFLPNFSLGTSNNMLNCHWAALHCLKYFSSQECTKKVSVLRGDLQNMLQVTTRG